MSRPRVIYWNNIPSLNMVERFNAVAHRGNLNFEAWFNARKGHDRSWTVDEAHGLFPYRYVPSVGFGRHRLNLPTSLLGRNPPDVLASLYAEPSFVLGWAEAELHG